MNLHALVSIPDDSKTEEIIQQPIVICDCGSDVWVQYANEHIRSRNYMVVYTQGTREIFDTDEEESQSYEEERSITCRDCERPLPIEVPI